MSTSLTRPSLRNVLLFDAATCALMGLVLVLGSGPLAALTAIPPALLFYAGLSLFPITVFMAAVASRRTTSAAGVWFVIVGNVGWVAGSLLLFRWIAPNAFGVVFILGQAAVVAVLAWLEYTAVRGARLILETR